jgi:hypothetical protein
MRSQYINILLSIAIISVTLTIRLLTAFTWEYFEETPICTAIDALDGLKLTGCRVVDAAAA